MLAFVCLFKVVWLLGSSQARFLRRLAVLLVLTTLPILLCLLENHILEDVNKCVIALQERDVDGLDRTAGAIRGRAARVVHVVTSEMDNYEPGVYTEKVLEATKLLTDTGRDLTGSGSKKTNKPGVTSCSHLHYIRYKPSGLHVNAHVLRIGIICSSARKW